MIKKYLLTLLFTIFFFFTASTANAANNNALLELPRTGNQPLVVSQKEVNLNELPRTGIPAAAWAIAALAPLGIGLLRRKNGVKSYQSANTIWTEKQFKNDL